MPSAWESLWLATLGSTERSELQDLSASHSLPDPDLLVLGSDLIGLATAYFAAERGARVLVLADDSNFGHDVEASLGLIIPNACGWQFSQVTQPLAQGSRDWWAKLAVRPGFQIDWRVSGALMIDARRLLPDPRSQMLAGLEAGYSLHEVDAEQIGLMEPALAPCPAGGLHYPSEAVIHPLRAALGFVRGLRSRGAQIVRCSIDRPLVTSGRVTSIQTATGAIRAKTLFTAVPTMLRMIEGIESTSPTPCTIKHRKYLASAPQSSLLNRPILDANWLVQLKSGEFLIEVEDTGEGAIDSAVNRARQLVPALNEVDFSRTWSSTSERTADRIPVIDKSRTVDNVWYCQGLDFGSVQFAPLIGKSVADWMLTGQRSEDLAAFAARSR